MIRRASAARAELDAGHQEMMELLSGLSGRVAVVAVLTPSTLLLPAAITRLKARPPRPRPARAGPSEQSLPVITSLLRQSDMVPALRDELVRPYVAAVLLDVLDSDLGLRKDIYSIVSRRGRQLSPGAELMLECLREEAFRNRERR
ncbi:hypothetical protein [Roseateles sp.]|uniref:hypothetical protein n=1 Tax=Roseateles sp. TaxID=1971397 RepID=UPI0025DD70D7|nr:hypothetical protein [Roseateles sp.]